METKDFYYDLPKELIAQTPVEPRDSSRLLVMNKTSGELEHRHFYDITEYLQPGDCLIVNDSRVLPARIYGSKKDTGGHIEFLLLTQKEQDVWEVLAKPGRKAQPGTWFVFGEGLLEAQVLEILEDGKRLVRFHYQGNFYALLEQIRKSGEIPDGIFQRIGVCCSAYGRLAFYTGTHEEAGRKGRSFWIRDFACRVRYFSSCQCRKGRRTYHAL